MSNTTWTTDLAEFTSKSRQQHEQELARLKFLEDLQQTYPDLKRHVNRWKHERFTSAMVNSQATDFEAAHNCGCCNDSPLEIWPYIKLTDHTGQELRLYAEGIPFRVGEKNPWGYGDISYPGWEEKLRKASIPEVVIQRVSCLLDDEEEDDGSDEED